MKAALPLLRLLLEHRQLAAANGLLSDMQVPGFALPTPQQLCAYVLSHGWVECCDVGSRRRFLPPNAEQFYLFVPLDAEWPDFTVCFISALSIIARVQNLRIDLLIAEMLTT